MTSRWPWRLRLFVGHDDEVRARRTSDGLVLAAAVVGLGLVSLVAVPTSGVEAALARVVEALPTALAGVWRLAARALVLGAAMLVVATAVRRRWRLLRDEALAGLAATAVGLVLARAVTGSWELVWSQAPGPEPVPWLAWTAATVPIAVLAVAVPHLTRSVRHVARWLIGLGVGGMVLLGLAAPTQATASWLVGIAAAAIVHVAWGSTRGRPDIDDIAAALAAFGVEVGDLAPAIRQRAGVYLLDAMHVDGRPLDVKVYGGDAVDTQFVHVMWRNLWYRDAGPMMSPRRLHQVEHEALMTLLAAQAGVTTQPVVAVGVTANDDAILVLERIGSRWAVVGDAEATPGPVGPAGPAGDVALTRARQAWAVLTTLHRARIAHRAVDAAHLVVVPEGVDGAGIGLVDFQFASAGSDDWLIGLDRAQLLVETCLALGVTPAVEVAADVLGRDGVAQLLPFVQQDACTTGQRRRLRSGDRDVDDIRAQAAAAIGADPPELERLRRVTWRSLLQAGLPILAFAALVRVASGLDLSELATAIEAASPWFLGVGFLLGQLPRVTQALSALGASPVPIPLSRLVTLQFAQAYIALTVPSSAARIAMNVRFFQRHGLPSGTALAAGALDSLFGFASQVLLLAAILSLTSTSLDLDPGAASAGIRLVVTVVLVVAIIVAGVILVVPRLRRLVAVRVESIWTDALVALEGLGSPQRLGLLLGGNFATEVVAALTLGALAIAFGHPVGLGELLLIHVAVSLLAGIMPIPGGIGVVEGGLTYGLAASGVPEESAFAIAITFRLATYYLPPLWGLFAFRWLERNRHL